jgi:hypothetical protein
MTGIELPSFVELVRHWVPGFTERASSAGSIHEIRRVTRSPDWQQGGYTSSCTDRNTLGGKTTEIGLSQAVTAKGHSHRHAPQRFRSEGVSGSNPLVGSYCVAGRNSVIAQRAGRLSARYSGIPRRPALATGPRVVTRAARRLGQARANPSRLSTANAWHTPPPWPCSARARIGRSRLEIIHQLRNYHEQ